MSLMHKVQVTPLIGLPQFDGWSQVVTNDDATLTIAIAVGGVNAGNVGRDLVIQLAQAKPQTAAELHTLLLDTLHAATTVGSQIAIGACCCIGDLSIFAAYQGSVLLKRGSKSGVVVSAPDTVKVVEGKHTLDDVVVVATSQATSFFGEIQQKLAQGFDVDTIVTSIVPGLHTTTNSALSCMAFISFDEQTPVVEEKPLFEIALEAVEVPIIPPSEDEPSLPEPPVSPPLEPMPPVESLPLRTLDLEREDDQPPVPEKPDPSLEVPGTVQASVENQATSSHALEVRISSSSTEKIANTLGPLVTKLIQVGKQIGKLVVVGIKKTPAVLQRFKNRAQPLYAGGQYVTSLPKQQVIKMVVPVLIGLALIAGAILAWQRWTASQVEAAVTAIEPLEQRFALAQEKVATQPIEARSEMEKILDELAATKSTFARQPSASRLIDTRHQQLQALYTELSGQHTVSALPVFFDLQSVQSDLLVSKADADATRAALLDTEKKQLVLLNLTTKEHQLVSLESIAKPVHLSLTPNEALLLGSGIRKVALSDLGAGLQEIKAEGDSNRDGVLIGSFGAYIYIVNPVKRNIYRYSPGEDEGYTDPIGWLKPGQSLPYDLLTSVAIDGDVWLGTREGEILKLTQGSQQAYEIKGLPKAFAGPIYVYTKENVAQLYVLEPGQRRLVILKKTGEFIREVTSDSLASATSVFADETLGKAFAVSGSLLFEVGL